MHQIHSLLLGWEGRVRGLESARRQKFEEMVQCYVGTGLMDLPCLCWAPDSPILLNDVLSDGIWSLGQGMAL